MVGCVGLRPVYNVSRARLLLAYFIGTVAAFWFVQRLAGFA
ncbi:hypothetical protein T190_31615 [Sinorhizobium meliloti CCBAU 01290]|nr:hypothetical protein T190_31615 [Sinorhizobium meliloti CCBAU 01290]